MAKPKLQAVDFEQLYRDLEALPENKVGEIINGVLHTNPRPSGPHGRAASVLGMDIGSPFDRGVGGPGGWWIIDEPSCTSMNRCWFQTSQAGATKHFPQFRKTIDSP